LLIDFSLNARPYEVHQLRTRDRLINRTLPEWPPKLHRPQGCHLKVFSITSPIAWPRFPRRRDLTSAQFFFPIAECVRKHEAQLNGELNGILGKKVTESIRRVQPYAGGKAHGDTLWRLHQLDIIDKHRLLIAVGCLFEKWGVSVEWRNIHHLSGGGVEITAHGTEPAWFDPLLGTIIGRKRTNQSWLRRGYGGAEKDQVLL
jgi:hypothetical protein